MPKGVYDRRPPRTRISVADGGCGTCGRPRDGDAKTLCVACRDRIKRRSTDLIARGLCVGCAVGVCENGKQRCPPCLGRTRDRVQRIKDAGVCGSCRQRPAIASRLSCDTCFLKRTAWSCLGDRSRWEEILWLFNSQNGICALTGAKMILGVSVSLDHIVPVSRGGTNDLSNLRWTTWAANKAKNNMLDKEFVELCVRVVMHAQ